MAAETSIGRSVDVVTITLNPAIDQTVTIPEFGAGKVNRVQHTRSDPGGKGVNVAHILADYGHTVAVTGFLGAENTAPFDALFARKQIADHFVRIAGQTRVGIKIADPVLRQTTDINFPGQAPTAADVQALYGRLEAVHGRWVVLAGSLPPGIEATVYRDLIAALKASGSSVALDTSGEALRHALEAAPQVIKPNIHELEDLVGAQLTTSGGIVEAARTLLDRGIRLVAVSMGGEGACFVDDNNVVLARPPAVEVKSTVGAGDAMVAGIVAGQLRNMPPAVCARLATAFSVDAISHIGSGLSSPAAIEAGIQQVTVEELAG
jgi:1-phosphofructokinase